MDGTDYAPMGSRGKTLASWIKCYALVITAVCVGVTIALFVRIERTSSPSPSPPESNQSTAETVWPAIGVLTIPSESHVGLDYIPASYVRWIESAGAIVVPIPSGVSWNKSSSIWRTQPSRQWSPERVDHMFHSINALVLPGGDPWPQVSSSVLRQLYNASVTANSNGGYFPIWGTCAGFETMVILARGGCEAAVRDGNIPESCEDGPIVRGFDAANLSLPLSLTSGARTSRLLAGARPDLLNSAEVELLTFNNHAGGVSPKYFAANISGVYHALSTNTDRAGREFVSLMEGKQLPFYGSQFHPEKPIFEWGVRDSGVPVQAINHTQNAIQLSQHFANFLVSESKKSSHKFSTRAELIRSSMYSMQSTVVSKPESADMQVYLFNWTTAAT